MQVKESETRGHIGGGRDRWRWLTAYAKIARRCRDDMDLGVSRYPYELAPGVSPFSGSYFEHRE
jgi:hypothetical protein